MGMDINNFFVGIPMERPKFVRIPFNFIPDEVVKEYYLKWYEHYG